MQRRERSAAQSAGITDGVLVGQALAGDERAFESLVHRYDASLAHCISRYLGDDEQAGDVLQDVWLQLYRSLPVLHTGVPLGPWLLRMARNGCLDELRIRHRRRVVCFSDLEGNTDMEEPALLATLPDPHPLPEEIADQHERQHALTQAVQALPPRLRAVVLLRYAGQLSFVEIGQALKMPAMTAKASFYRAPEARGQAHGVVANTSLLPSCPLSWMLPGTSLAITRSLGPDSTAIRNTLADVLHFKCVRYCFTHPP